MRCLCALTPSQQQPTPNSSLARAPAGLLDAAHLTLPRNRRAKKNAVPSLSPPEKNSLFVCPLNHQNGPRPRLQTGVGDTRPRATNLAS